MTIDRRTAIRLGAAASALPFLPTAPAHAEDASGASRAGTRAAAEGTRVTVEGVVRARPLPLSAVRLTGGPLAHAQQLDARYLLSLDPDRFLALFRKRAGIATAAEPYGGWDGDGHNLSGHAGGHYLSAVSLMFAATGDAQFKERADRMVAGMKEAQDANGGGYLCAIENARPMFEELSRGVVKSASFELNGLWVPWYTQHKVYAGLRDAYRHAGNRTALDVLVRVAGWTEGVVGGLSDAQLAAMLNTEHGGMTELFSDLYADTGDRRWLDLSDRFEHIAFIRPLQRQQDQLAGKHGNTAVPKVLGSAARYVAAGRPEDLMAAGFFWGRVVDHHSFATGGHGKDEFFGLPDRLSTRVEGRTCESCNVYNMLKLTRSLFSLRPDADYGDFQERALFNHALSSMDPEDGRTCYMVPVGPASEHEYHHMYEDFTCCVGSGMENHALHGHGIHYEDGETLWLTTYVPSMADWAEGGVRITTGTVFPEGESATLKFEVRQPRELTLALRRPYWAGDGFSVRVNGQTHSPTPVGPAPVYDGRSQYVGQRPDTSTFVEIRRTWRTGDVVEVALPKSLRLEPMADDPRTVAILWGPLVLAGDLGPETGVHAEGPLPKRDREVAPPTPILIAADKRVTDWLKPVPGQPGRFRTAGVGMAPDASGRPMDIELVPFYRLHRRTYSTYWKLLTDEEWAARKARG